MLDGENAFDRPVVDLHDAAIELGALVAALRGVDATGGAAVVSRRADERLR